MSVRYFKWETEHGMAYGKLPADYVGTHFIGITKKHVASISINDPLLVETTKAEFSDWWDNCWPTP